MVALLDEADKALINSARRAVLATIAPDGRPRLVPITFAFAERDGAFILYSALDEKPKSVADPRDLARVRDIRRRPRVSVLVDHWDEDWGRLAWLRLDGSASVVEPTDPPAAEHADAIRLFRRRYPQYASMALAQCAMLRVEIERATRWSAAAGQAAGS